MKKLIGIILALCMLTTMAAAATIENPNATATLETMTVSVTYTALANNAQATLFAYKVADTATADAIPAYENQTTTPIVGIDQEASDGTFEFKVATEFRGKIAVKIGGADVATPVAMLVEFKDAVTPGPGEGGGEGGETPVDPPVNPEQPEMVEVTVYCGDVNGDDVADDTDAAYILGSIGRNDKYGDYAIGTVITTIDGKTIVCGDVNGDDVADDTDAAYILGSIGRNDKYGDYAIGTAIVFQVEATPEA